MCPLCVASVVLAAAGATSAGGITALVVKKVLRKKSQTEGDER